MKTLPISEARAHLTELVDDVDRLFSRVLLTKSGQAKAVLMSSDEFDEWTETLEILSHTPTMKALKEAQDNVAADEFISHQDVLGELRIT